MNRLFCILLLVAGVGLGGCTAGSAYTHQTFTVMQQANIENAKVLGALHDFALASERARDLADIAELKDRTRLLVISYQSQPEDTREVWLDDQLEKMEAGLSKNIEASIENRRRLAILMDTATSNLTFSNLVAEQAKKYILFRSSIDAQWKAFISSQLSSLLAANARKASATVPVTLPETPKPLVDLVPE